MTESSIVTLTVFRVPQDLRTGMKNVNFKSCQFSIFSGHVKRGTTKVLTVIQILRRP